MVTTSLFFLSANILSGRMAGLLRNDVKEFGKRVSGFAHPPVCHVSGSLAQEALTCHVDMANPPLPAPPGL
jgi:hypothetical protein